jgi:hypothetical protein
MGMIVGEAERESIAKKMETGLLETDGQIQSANNNDFPATRCQN